MSKLSRRGLAAIIAAVLITVGFCMAKYAESGAGMVDVRRTEFMTSDGHRMSAKLYIPENATADDPAPAILAAPGGNANLENLSDPCIELSRRGFVVMAFDPYTIGRSDSVSAPDNGAREAMKYMRSLAFVDNENIGAFGHSAGTGRARWAVTDDGEQKHVAEGIKAVFYLAAGQFDLEGVNHGIYIGSWDNTYPAGGAHLSARELDTAESFTTALGVDRIEFGKWYGSVADGSARVFYTGNSGHPSALVLPQPILIMTDFFSQALHAPLLEAKGLIYPWKEFGTALGIIGILMMMFPVLSILFDMPFFESVKRPMPEPVSGVNAPFLFYCIMPAVINTLLCKWAIYNGQNFLGGFNRVLRINNTNGFVFWFACSAMLTVVILAIRFRWDGTIDRERILTHAKTTWPNFFKSLLLGVMAVGVVFGLTYFADVLSGLAPRIWKVQLNTLDARRIGVFLTYFPLYLLFFGVFNFSQTIGLKIKGQSEGRFTFLVWLTSTIPSAAFLIYAYGKLWITGYTAITNVQMSRANGTLLNTILTYFITCKVTTYCYKKTGGYHTGAVINAILMTWTAVAADIILAV